MDDAAPTAMRDAFHLKLGSAAFFFAPPPSSYLLLSQLRRAERNRFLVPSPACLVAAIRPSVV